MKMTTRAASGIGAAIAFVLLIAVAALIFRQMQERISLIRDNDNERILTALFAALRDHDDFGSAIEEGGSPVDRVAGIGVYLADGSPLYAWGSAPAEFTAPDPDCMRENNPGRYIIPDKKGESMQFIVRTSRMGPPPPGGMPRMHRRERGFFFDVLGKGDWLYVDIRHTEYWRSKRILAILFPVCAALIGFLVFYFRYLVLGNVEYRDRIEKQKNLVVLGTAASTLAHEIKNPLLAIRLQTGILRKTCPKEGLPEIEIIDAEIERLSALTFRINDYLRDPRGYPESLVLAEEVKAAAGVLGVKAPIEEGGESVAVFMDRERLRSVVENILLNALESGGPPGEVETLIRRKDGNVVISISDRGSGIASEDEGRLFEPFFTTKSRGTGIGLAVSRRFVQAAGGTIGISRRDGGGTTVTISLPEGKVNR